MLIIILQNKVKLFAFLLIFILGCTEKSFNKLLLEKNLGDAKQGVIISCIRCNCVLSDLEKVVKQNKGVNLYGDTNCISPISGLDVRFLAQRTLDSIYDKNYNIILFKWNRHSKFLFKLVETNKSPDIQDIAKSFFGN